MLALRRALLAAFHLVLHLRIDKQAERMLLAQNIIGASSDDDTVGLLRKFLNQAALLTVDRIILLHDWINSHVKASPDRNRIQRRRTVLHHMLHIALRQLRTVCNLTDDLIIVISNSQLIGQSLSDLTSAAAKFSSNRYNPRHWYLLSPVWGLFFYLKL